MAKIRDNLGLSLKMGAWVTAVVFLLNMILDKMGMPVTTLFGIQPATGITPTIGTKIISILQSIVAFDIPSIVAVWLTASVLILVGTYVMEYLPLPAGKADWTRLALVLLYGTAVFWIILVGLEVPSLNALVGLAVYYGAVALTLQLAQKYVKKLL